MGINLRLYNDKDDKQLSDMLIVEGIPDKDMRYKEYETYVMEEDGIIEGFFTIKKEHGCPSIQHFCIDKKHRSPMLARKLARFMKDTVENKGFRNLILHSKNEILDKFIEYYFKKKPYAVNGINKFYFVEV